MRTHHGVGQHLGAPEAAQVAGAELLEDTGAFTEEPCNLGS